MTITYPIIDNEGTTDSQNHNNLVDMKSEIIFVSSKAA